MAVHFLLSARARTLSVATVARMSDEEAHQKFVEIRWADNNGEPVCPRCGGVVLYTYKARRIWKCKACTHQFSVTSGTIFASRKLPVRDHLLAIAIFVNGAKGISALQLGRDLDVQYRTAFVLAHKLREAMASEYAGMTVEGTVEVDGAYVGGHIRPANEKKNRVDRRLAENQTGKRRVVVIARERKGRTLTTVTKAEAEGVAFVAKVVKPGSTVHADEAAHWDTLHARFPTKRINHQIAYSLDGACTNQAESFLARLRKMIDGQHHHVSPQYLYQYANHAAWMEDHRRVDNGSLATMTLDLALSHKVSRNWKGYWQRHKET
ncbi:MAG: IS1595 family transposase [Hyphomicrobiaceae bacterium]|nr:IS1595 family transposase [Hyphomicrobiaceae bacterium]